MSQSHIANKHVIQGLAVAALMCSALLYATGSIAAPSKKGPGKRAVPVVVAEVKMHRLAPVTLVSGTVISRNDARLSTEVEGQVKKVLDVGSRVKEDDVVARIDDIFAKLKIEELQSAVERERAQLDFEREEVKRLRRLAKQNNAARTQLEQTQANKQIAKNNLEIARTRVKLAKEELWRHRVRAPFSGVIAERYVRRGERVEIGKEIVRLIDLNALEVRARVPLSSINYVKEGVRLDLLSDVDDASSLRGTVRTIVPVGDERSRLMDLRVDFTGAQWRVGQQVRVALPTANLKEVLAIPRDALVLRRDGASVFRIKEDGSAEKVSVTLGIAVGDLIEVIGQLTVGDQVVTRGGERLRPGQHVKILPSESSGTSRAMSQSTATTSQPKAKPGAESDNK